MSLWTIPNSASAAALLALRRGDPDRCRPFATPIAVPIAWAS